MTYNSTLSEDVDLIARKALDINKERLEHELLQFQREEELDLDLGLIERYRRKPERRDVLFQALKDLKENKGLEDDKVRKLIASKNYPDSIDRIVDAIITVIRTKDFKDYKVQLHRGSGVFINETVFDAPYQFLLRNNNFYIANLGFFPYPGIIEINEIHGFPGREKELEPLKWSRYLIRTAVDWAIRARIPEVGIKPHRQNGWEKVYYNSNGHSHLVYDVSAKREGFSYDEKRKLFVLRSGGNN